MTDPSAHRRAIPFDARVSQWRAPDGWMHRRFDWAGTGRGRLLFQTGRGDIFEKYLETIAHFNERGWAVTAFDWRGQGGSGRLSDDPNVGHADDFGVFVADLAAFWRHWTAGSTGPTAILGHSMGGHLVLRALAERAIDPTAAILVAPMLGLKSPFGRGLSLRIARIARALGDPKRAAWKAGERPGGVKDRQKMLTGDRSRYDDERWWLAENPALTLGPPSWAWMAEAFASTAAAEADPRLDTLATPVLMLVADHDTLVDPRAAVRIAARLPAASLVRFGSECAHEILREADPVRDRALLAIDTFLDSAAPATACR